MRINHNISSLTTQNALGKVQTQLDKSMKKLSTGLRINSAADDAAGMAISHKLRTQVKGLEMASRNSLDGVSLVQTAEGALAEVQNMLQRIRQLAIQSSNDTLQAEDRAAVQLEVNQLIKEIDDTSIKTEFNKIKLLNGDSARATSSSNSAMATCTYTSDAVDPSNVTFKIDKVGTPAMIASDTSSLASIIPCPESKLTLNGEIIEITPKDDATAIVNKLKELCDRAGIKTAVIGTGTNNTWSAYQSGTTGSSLLLYTAEAGSNQSINISSDSSALLEALGFNSSTTPTGTGVTKGCTSDAGTDAVVSAVMYKGKNVLASCDGNEVEITADAGQVMRMNINAFVDTRQTSVDNVLKLPTNPKNPMGTAATDTSLKTVTISATAATNVTLTGINGYNTTSGLTIDMLDFGPIILHVGPNENMTLEVQIPDINADGLKIRYLNLASREGAEAAIPMVDEALSRVSDIRSRLGAYQNRLEYTINNLDTTRENATASLSRVEDTDMAAEMSEQTQKNVLSQAGISILAQANQRPQQILSLLQ